MIFEADKTDNVKVVCLNKDLDPGRLSFEMELAVGSRQAQVGRLSLDEDNEK